MQSLKGCAWASLLLAGMAAADAAPPTASIADLAWMTGAWEGPMGENAVLQETWLEPADDAMMAAVRLLEDGKTNMVELIVIEESEGTLIFRIQQWSKSYEPRMPAPQKLVLAELGDNSVRFEAEEVGNAFRSLTYSRPSPEAFNIKLELTEPPTGLDINLRRR
ncbi:MAG: hypothetical protein F4X81_02865 [Gammaproteobacteria bacterium]|nr:hypothetical protein [Gammaproteobacteria bacterium]MYE50393.1 hypothetical protein [Gammaproteobacteria bacterium]